VASEKQSKEEDFFADLKYRAQEPQGGQFSTEQPNDQSQDI
jgi:hypothetical protein